MSLRIERDNNGVMTCWLDNPSKRNALNDQMLVALCRALNEASSDPAFRLIVIRGSNGTFCSGRDIGELKPQPDESDALLEARIHPVTALARAFQACEIPTVAAVQGKAVGLGVSLATWADVAVISDDSTFSVPEARVGITPSFTAISLARKVGRAAALAMCFSGLTVPASEAARTGLAQFVFPVDGFDQALADLCLAICKGGPWSLYQCKQFLNTSQDLSWDEALDNATRVAIASMKHDEATQGIAARQARTVAAWAR